MPAPSAPLVSVLMPSYNHADYVVGAIQSCLDQTYPHVEVVVVDDGSSDRSHEVLRQFESHPRVTVRLHAENRGQSSVLNEAIDLARGELLAILPSDDWFLPEKTALQVAKFQQSGPEVGVVYGAGRRYFEDTGRTLDVTVPMYRGRIVRELLTKPFCVYPASPMFRRECFDEVRFDTSYRAEGEALYVKLAVRWAFDFVEQPVVVMRDHERNTGKDTYLMYAENERYWTEFFDQPDLPGEVRALRSERLGLLHRSKGLELLTKHRDRAAARRALLKAVRLRPRYLADHRVVAGLGLAMLPGAIADRLLDRRQPRRSTRLAEIDDPQPVAS